MRSNEAYADNKKLAAEAAVETFKFSKKLENLEKVLKDNVKNIKNFNTNNLECYESLGLVKDALEDAYGAEVDSDFIVKNINLIEKASTGSAKAVEELGRAIAKETVENLEIAKDNLDAFSGEDFK
jgi:hypothetical protein